jgi:hypothetical protein
MSRIRFQSELALEQFAIQMSGAGGRTNVPLVDKLSEILAQTCFKKWKLSLAKRVLHSMTPQVIAAPEPI